MNMNRIVSSAFHRMHGFGLRTRPLFSKNANRLNGACRTIITFQDAVGTNRHRSAALRSKYSTAPVAVTDPHETSHRKKSKRVEQKKKRDPIIVTERAANRIKEILASPNGIGAIGIKLGVKRRGCNGLSYTLNYAFEEDTKPSEERFTTHGVTVIIEPMALFNVVGTVMDWEETDMSSEFTFENPNSKGECGCGESFNV